jgi:vacuolar protein sorting-associated protein 35
MYLAARRTFVKEGVTTVMRLKHTIPPLIFCALRLAETVRGLGDETANTAAKRVFKFVFENLKTLAQANYPTLALRLYLQAVVSAGRCQFEEIAYEFFAQAFALYEEHIPETKAQIQALQLICGTLQSTHFFETENYDRLVGKTAGQSAKLLQKHDQARAVYACSHLFWKDGSGEVWYHTHFSLSLSPSLPSLPSLSLSLHDDSLVVVVWFRPTIVMTN